jgi:hypothetical protein
MASVLNVILPVFAQILAGCLRRRTGILGPSAWWSDPVRAECPGQGNPAKPSALAWRHRMILLPTGAVHAADLDVRRM